MYVFSMTGNLKLFRAKKKIFHITKYFLFNNVWRIKLLEKEKLAKIFLTSAENKIFKFLVFFKLYFNLDILITKKMEEEELL